MLPPLLLSRRPPRPCQLFDQARLLENKNYGVVTSVMSLLIGLASKSQATYEGLVPHVIALLTRLVSSIPSSTF